MRVYVIIQQALYDNSSYYDVVCVKSNLTDAKIVVETSVKDILSNNLLGFEQLIKNLRNYINF